LTSNIEEQIIVKAEAVRAEAAATGMSQEFDC